jgi:hypothetical protein
MPHPAPATEGLDSVGGLAPRAPQLPGGSADHRSAEPAPG